MQGKVDIDKLALLARIKLSEKEKEKLQKEFGEILEYVSKLKEVDVSGISEAEAGKIMDLENVTREDENTHKPTMKGGYVKVKHVLK